MKKTAAILLCFTILLGMAGCSARNRQEKPTELWVLTEETTADGMNYIAQTLAGQFAEKHPGSSVRLDILPTEEAEREAYLEKLRVKISAGDGPDIFLMPSVARLVTETPEKYSYYVLESLFPDVRLAMENGIFADLRVYYDQDAELNKDGLLDTVMDAGTLDGHRYVLPLRFDMMTYCIVPPLLEETGLSEACFRQDLGSCFCDVLETRNPELLSGLTNFVFPAYFFSDYVDYDTREVRVQKEDLLECARLMQKIMAQSEFLLRYNIFKYQKNKDSVPVTPVRLQLLSSMLDAYAIGKMEQQEMTFLPLSSMDGAVTANVTYYAAVSASCQAPELAYQYLRMFLSEDVQWESARRQPASTQYEGLLESSWPVRTVGSTAVLWENYLNQLNKGTKLLQSLNPQDNILESITDQIDSVSFLTDASYALQTVLVDKNPEERIDQWLSDLQYRMMEG